MSNPSQELSTIQNEATGILSKANVGFSLAMIAMIAIAQGDLTTAVIGGGLFAALGLIASRLKPSAAHILTAQAMVGTAITCNAALIGNPLQIDSHMLYFAVLAMISLMTSLRALIISAGTIAVHHLVLTFAMPALVYPSTDLWFNIERTTFHAVIVILESSALFYMVLKRWQGSELTARKTEEALQAADVAKAAMASAQQEKQRAEEALAQARESSAQAEAAGRAAEEALHENELARQEREKLQAQNDQAREKHDQALQHLLTVFELHLDQLSSGDLSTRITEALDPAYVGLKDSFNSATEKLAAAIHDVREHSCDIQTQSREISTSANDLSARTERQAATLTEIAHAVEDLTKALHSVASESSDAQTLAEATSKEAADSSVIMEQAVDAMSGLENSSHEINKITSVIDDIAFQTNLLALNAGVEAARAGDAGRGFAVVASEVRALAQRSSDAAREINQLIARSNQQVQDGVDLVKRTGDALSGIKASVDKITRRLQSSAEATRDQSQNLSNVNHSISELESVTQQNAAMFEQTTAANKLLSEGARALSEMVQTFVTTPHETSEEQDGYDQSFSAAG